MSISPLTLIVFIANGITSLLAAALLMLVLFQAPRQRANQIFAVAMLLLGVYGAVNGFARFLDRLDVDPEPVFYLATQLYGGFSVAIFFFATEFTARPTRLMRVTRWLGVVLVVLVGIVLWTGKMTTNFQPIASDHGSYRWEYTMLGSIAPLTVFAYLLAATVILYKAEDERLQGMWRAPALVAASTVSAIVIWPIVPIPLNALFLAAAALAMGVPVLRHELFNPLAQYNEELARRNIELQEANRLKSEFLANMSHELRTPLNSIIGYTELVLSGIYGDVNDTQRNRLEKVVRNGNHLLALINDVLDLNKIEAGGLTLDRRTVHTHDLLDAVVATIKPLAAEKDLTITQDYADVPALYGDQGRIEQIMNNVLSNAVKFTHQGEIRVQAARQGEMVQIDISDTGIGIHPDQQEEVFAEFRQADNSTTRQYEGTGLGLAITRRLVELHGGKIWLESALNQGTTVHIQLPAAEPSGGLHEPAASGQGQTILVIDDSRDAAEMLSDTLTQTGYRVVTANSGEEGLAYVRTHHPALITLDVHMPNLDGWQVLRQIKSSDETRHIPVIIVSMIDNHALALELGANDTLPKPVDRSKLIEAIQSALHIPASYPLVLVVDDQETERKLIAMGLQRSGFRVNFAAGGREALHWLENHTPDVILLDLVMPEVGGFEVLTSVRANPRLASVPVIVFTARGLNLEEQQFLAERAAGVVYKGLSGYETLLRTIQQALRNGSHPQQDSAAAPRQ